MRFHSTISEDTNPARAIEQVITDTRAAMKGKIDLVAFFFTGHHCADAESLAEQIWLQLDPLVVIGCSAEGVIGADREIERRPGLALLAGEMPGVHLHPFHIAGAEWRHLLTDHAALSQRMHLTDQPRALIGLGDPFTTPLNPLLSALDTVAPGVPLVGGMASAAAQPGQNVLVRNDAIYAEGFVGLTIAGPVTVQTVVSQGCRPIGRPLVITKGHDNVIEQLGGRSALAALSMIIDELPRQDQELLRNGLFVGRVISEYRDTFTRGDFLIRNVIGIDQEDQTIAVTDHFRIGQTIQFHVRDAATAHEDLEMMLKAQSATPSTGGLLFSCNGRGMRLFDTPGHDVGLSRAILPSAPVAGFFAAGEFGPVGSRNFVHGHTASFAFFRPES